MYVLFTNHSPLSLTHTHTHTHRKTAISGKVSEMLGGGTKCRHTGSALLSSGLSAAGQRGLTLSFSV